MLPGMILLLNSRGPINSPLATPACGNEILGQRILARTARLGGKGGARQQRQAQTECENLFHGFPLLLA